MLPAHEFHHDEVHVAGRLDFVDGDDVRVIERGECARFLLEPAAVLIRQALRRQHLDGYIAIEPRIASAIDLAHASGAQC